MARTYGAKAAKDINVSQGTRLTMTRFAEAETVRVGGILVKSRDGECEGTYDWQTGRATRN